MNNTVTIKAKSFPVIYIKPKIRKAGPWLDMVRVNILFAICSAFNAFERITIKYSDSPFRRFITKGSSSLRDSSFPIIIKSTSVIYFFALSGAKCAIGKNVGKNSSATPTFMGAINLPCCATALHGAEFNIRLARPKHHFLSAPFAIFYCFFFSRKPSPVERSTRSGTTDMIHSFWFKWLEANYAISGKGNDSFHGGVLR